MDKVFHPISGEEGFFATKMEKEIIDVALLLLVKETTPSSQESGVTNG